MCGSQITNEVLAEYSASFPGIPNWRLKDIMDLQLITDKLEMLWNFTSKMNVGQFAILALFIYMLPAIIRTMFDVLATTIKSLVRMIMFSIIAGVAINLYLGNGSEIAEMMNYILRFSKKAVKSLFQDS